MGDNDNPGSTAWTHRCGFLSSRYKQLRAGAKESTGRTLRYCHDRGVLTHTRQGTSFGIQTMRVNRSYPYADAPGKALYLDGCP